MTRGAAAGDGACAPLLLGRRRLSGGRFAAAEAGCPGGAEGGRRRSGDDGGGQAPEELGKCLAQQDEEIGHGDGYGAPRTPSRAGSSRARTGHSGTPTGREPRPWTVRTARVRRLVPLARAWVILPQCEEHPSGPGGAVSWFSPNVAHRFRALDSASASRGHGVIASDKLSLSDATKVDALGAQRQDRLRRGPRDLPGAGLDRLPHPAHRRGRTALGPPRRPRLCRH